jgi:hypothetical protein
MLSTCVTQGPHYVYIQQMGVATKRKAHGRDRETEGQKSV